jgi:hypothetical protein
MFKFYRFEARGILAAQNFLSTIQITPGCRVSGVVDAKAVDTEMQGRDAALDRRFSGIALWKS